MKNIIALLVFLVIAIASSGQDRKQPLDFKGKFFVSASDGDMVSSAYVNGLLGEKEGKDALSIVSLTGDYQSWKSSETEVSNSVAGPPSVLDVTPDGQFAFVIETFTQAPDNGRNFSDLASGSLLTVIDLSNPDNPRVSEKINIGKRPTSVAVHPDGKLIAIALYENGANNLALVKFESNKLGKIYYFSIPQIASKEPLNHVSWHPSGKYLAAVFEKSDQVAFVELQVEKSALQVKPWGNVVKTGKFPMKGLFTPDGNFFMVNCLYWGNDIDGTWIDAPHGQINSIRFDTTMSDKKVQHSNISTAQASISPEGITISNDGTLLVTTNLERSYLPYSIDKSEPRITWYSSLTLIHIDKQTGKLSTINHFYFDGILPESAVFDASDKYLAVCNYDHFDDKIKGSAIDFWRVERENGEIPKLIKTSHSIPVSRGVHSMVLVK